MSFKDYPVLKSIEVKDNYSLLARFSNGEKKLFDMSKEIQEDKFFFALKDKNLFSKCRVFGKGYAIQWNDDIDLACEYVYDNGILCNE